MIRLLSIFSIFILQLSAAEKYEIPADLKKEAEASIKKGVEYLLKMQHEDGYFGKKGSIANSSLCAMAVHKAPGIDKAVSEKSVNSALDYVLKFQQKDGSIFEVKEGQRFSYANYTTSIALLALAEVNRPKDLTAMKKARAYLIKVQISDPNSADFGGLGYSSSKKGRADMSNTSWAAEALHATEFLDKEPFNNDPEQKKKSDVMWQNMAEFVTNTQNLPETNKSKAVNKDEKQIGGMAYRPVGDASKENKLVTTATMSYAGLKTMIHAKLKKDDVRVKALLKYLMKHYSVKENPGMGNQGLFYYLHIMTKALDAYGNDFLKDVNGKKITWREDILKKFMAMQKDDGHWENENGRFLENRHELAGSYALIAMKKALAVK